MTDEVYKTEKKQLQIYLVYRHQPIKLIKNI